MDNFICEESKQNRSNFLPTVLNQVSDEDDSSHMGFVKVRDKLVMMAHKLIRVTIKQINALRG